MTAKAQQKSHNHKKITVSGYQTLVRQVREELSSLDFFVKWQTAESYWKVGQFIHEHLLKNKDRAGYGKKLFERLGNDVDRDETTLRKMVQFYRVYPIHARGRELGWSHYRALMSVKDDGQRKEFEKQIIQKNWDAGKFQKYLSTKRELEATHDGKSVPQLKVTRGRLNTFGVVEPEEGGEVLLDLGFRVHNEFPQGKKIHLKAGDCVEFNKTGGSSTSPTFKKTSAKREELFAYKAAITKIVDGDTLWVLIKLGFGISIQQKLRLRGINCPEIDTDEGKQAKKFVEARLKDCKFIIIKTHKDTFDKYDRYLADIFYDSTAGKATGEDEHKVAAEGTYLNQELLNNKLAVAVK